MSQIMISLMIISIILPLSLSSYKLLNNLDYDYYALEDEISLFKLRKTLLLAYNLVLDEDCMSFKYKNTIFNLRLNNGHLLMSPGSQIILEKIDECTFYDDGLLIYLDYKRDGKHYKKTLISKTWFYDTSLYESTDS